MGSLDPKMLTFGNFKETYGKLNYEILLLTSLQILLQQRKVYIFFFFVAVSLMVHVLVQKTHACSAQIRNIITRSSNYWFFWACPGKYWESVNSRENSDPKRERSQNRQNLVEEIQKCDKDSLCIWSMGNLEESWKCPVKLWGNRCCKIVRTLGLGMEWLIGWLSFLLRLFFFSRQNMKANSVGLLKM